MELAVAPASGIYRNHHVLSDNLKCQYALSCSKSPWNVFIFPPSIPVSYHYQRLRKKELSIYGERNLQKSVLATSPWSVSTFPTSIQNCESGIRFPPSKCSGKDNEAQNEEVDNIGVRAAISTLKFYKREISPLLPKSCRYTPTCSEYSMIAYRKYGFVKGTILTAWRICRCNPLGGSGFDPPRWLDESSPPEQ